MGTSDQISICVFCGSRPGNSPTTSTMAGELGALLGARGHRLVYGAGRTGLMATVADATTAHGGQVLGIIPAFLYARERALPLPLAEQTLVVTADMFERKREMFSRADAFVALPGGYGTLDEILEVLSAAYLGLLAKPFVLLDVEGMWQPLVQMLGHVRELGFTSAGHVPAFQVAADPAEALDLIESQLAPDSARHLVSSTARDGL